MSTRVILADDFTGAGDSGVHFARAGYASALLLDTTGLEQEAPRFDVLSISTESRFLPPGEAATSVRELAARCRAVGVEIVFKKVDSTLRGNPGAEIETVLVSTAIRAALICTAIPKNKRVCRDGQLYLAGVPLHETEIGRDPFNPVPSSRIADILALQTALPAANLSLADVRSGPEKLAQRVRSLLDAQCRILIADAETDADLAALGALLRSAEKKEHGLFPLLAVGAGGLAEAYTNPLSSPRSDSATPPKQEGRILAVVGSLTDVSRVQAELAIKAGAFAPLTLDVAAGLLEPEKECARLAQEARQAGDAHLLLHTLSRPADNQLTTQDGERAAALFGKAALAISLATPCPVLYATGGSTAVGIAAAFGIKAIRLETECMPGVVLSSCVVPATGTKWFISKAGGFGSPQTLQELAERFTPGRSKPFM
ncbi:Hrp-dependent type III effector protein [Betaproteobacteria bacterium]|nr:Hrp-dependent type III effector protein [Betaproteobacteria bacterium]